MLSGNLNAEKRNQVDVGHSRGGTEVQNPRDTEEKVWHDRGSAGKRGRIPDGERAGIKINRDMLVAQEQGWY